MLRSMKISVSGELIKAGRTPIVEKDVGRTSHS
jgi:hypothetical protein